MLSPMLFQMLTQMLTHVLAWYIVGNLLPFVGCYVVYVATLCVFSVLPKSARFALTDLTAADNPYVVQTCSELLYDYALCMLSFKKMAKRTLRIVLACSLPCALECLAAREYVTFGALTMGSFLPAYGIVAMMPTWLRVLPVAGILVASLRTVRPQPIEFDRFPELPTTVETRRRTRGTVVNSFYKGSGKELGAHILQHLNDTKAHVLIFKLLHQSVMDMRGDGLWPKDARIILKGSTSLAIRCHAVLPSFAATLLCSIWKVFSGGDLDIQLHFPAETPLADQRGVSKALLYRIASNYNESFGERYMQHVRERLDDAYGSGIVVREVAPGDQPPAAAFYIKQLTELCEHGCSQKVQTSVEKAPLSDGMLLTRNTIKWTYSPYAAWWKRLIPRTEFHLDRAWSTFEINGANGDPHPVVVEHIDVVTSSKIPPTRPLVV
jgi:hypothetical protein